MPANKKFQRLSCLPTPFLWTSMSTLFNILTKMPWECKFSGNSLNLGNVIENALI